MDNALRVSVFGAGYVGLVTAAGLAAIGHHVLCVDVDEKFWTIFVRYFFQH
jgi:UDPglucose 6-dehydrogenase